MTCRGRGNKLGMLSNYILVLFFLYRDVDYFGKGEIVYISYLWISVLLRGCLISLFISMLESCLLLCHITHLLHETYIKIWLSFYMLVLLNWALYPKILVSTLVMWIGDLAWCGVIIFNIYMLLSWWLCMVFEFSVPCNSLIILN